MQEYDLDFCQICGGSDCIIIRLADIAFDLIGLDREWVRILTRLAKSSTNQNGLRGNLLLEFNTAYLLAYTSDIKVLGR